MAKYYFIVALFFFSMQSFCQKKVIPPFTSNRLRIDIIIRGTDRTATIEVQQYLKEPLFSTPPKSFIDSFQYGQYQFELQDLTTNKVLFSNGFSSLFNEWQTTPQATKQSLSFGKTLIMPFPTDSVLLKIYACNDGHKTEILCDTIDPKVILSRPSEPQLNPQPIYYSGNSKHKLDILILGDGYTRSDKPDFYGSAKDFADALLKVKPYKENRKNINFWAICPIAAQSGISYARNTSPLGCAYNAIESDRYLYTIKNREIADAASQTPYDQIIILTNSSKYGGGGIYNDYAVAAAGGTCNFQVMIHEFAHSFAGLGDEYAYNDPNNPIIYYSAAYEPWEPNITNLVNFSTKWQSALPPNTPIPTPDSIALSNPIGVYEGAGYQSKGMFRPSNNCRMRSTQVDYFCKVCQDAIRRKIRSYAR